MAARARLALGCSAMAAGCLWAARRYLGWLESDDAWLALADSIRASLEPPSQSNFRVVAVVRLKSRWARDYVVGTNIEAHSLRNSVCAERTAFGALQLRAHRGGRRNEDVEVRCVYIVCDAARPITPGLLCREFMHSSPYCSPGTRVVTASPGLEKRIETTLRDLLPHASPYSRLDALAQKEWALSRTLALPPAGGRLRKRLDAVRRPLRGAAPSFDAGEAPARG